MLRSRWCVIKPAYSVSFLLSINIFVWQNVLYFLDAPRIKRQHEENKGRQQSISDEVVELRLNTVTFMTSLLALIQPFVA